MSVYDMAKKYYPEFWNAQRIAALTAAGKLTEEEAASVLGEEAEGNG